MANTLTKRKIVIEDIYFDTAGTGATITITLPDSSTVTGTKFNAGHLPVKTDVRTAMTGVTDVNAAILWLYNNFDVVDASETAKGIIEIATLAEAQAGTDTIRAITPYLFKNVKATTTQFGTITLATNAEALAGTDAEKAITSASLQAKIDDSISAVGSIQRGIDLSNNADDADHDIDISAGVCADSTYAYQISFSAMTKRIDATWTSGSGNGGMATGVSLSANTWYHVFAIYNPTSALADAGFDTDLTASNLRGGATGYTKYRLLGSVLTDASSNILPFTYFAYTHALYYKSAIADYSGAITSNTLSLKTLSVPSYNVLAKFNCASSGATINGLRALSPSETDPTLAAFSRGSLTMVDNSFANDNAGDSETITEVAQLECMAVNSQVAFKTRLTTSFAVLTIGYIWNRGW